MSDSNLNVPSDGAETIKLGTPSAERKRNAELRRKEQQERRRAELEEKKRQEEEAKAKMKEKIRLRKEEAARKKAEKARLAEEEKARAEEERLRREEELRVSRQKAKEEAQRIREEQEAKEAAERAEAEAERAQQENKIAISRQKAKEEAERIKAAEEERIALEKAEKDAAQEKAVAALKKAKEDAARAKEERAREADARKAEKLRLEAEARERHLAMIAKAKEDAKRKKEEELQKKNQLEVLRREEEQAKMSARTARRKEELARKRAAEKAAEEEKKLQQEEEKKKFLEERRLAKERRAAEVEAARIKAEEEAAAEKARIEAEKAEREEAARLALLKHAEEAKKLKEQERDLEEEERQRLEAERAAEFEKEQQRRAEELAEIMHQEEERQKEIDAKLKELAEKGETVVVNRCGIFRVFGEDPGLEIWSVGDEQIVKIPQLKHHLRGVIGESHGSFQVARCYILLHTEFSKGRRHFHIHSWTGSKSEQFFRDQAEKRLEELEKGLYLEDVIAVHREMEGEESDQFKNYFPEGVEYVQPVILNKTEGPNKVDKSLFHIKGRKNVHAYRVPVSPDLINSGDVFVLETQKIIFQWNGRKANKMEKGKTLDLTIQMRVERNARARVVIVEEGEESHEANLFWEAMTSDAEGNGGERKVLAAKTPEEGGKDEEWEAEALSKFRFYSFGGPEDYASVADVPNVLLVEATEPDVSLLNENFCFVLDCFSEVYVWIGKETSGVVRDAATAFATAAGSESGRPAWAAKPIMIKQQCEIVLFKEKFTGSWGEYADFDFTRDAIQGNVAQLTQKEINIDEMHYPAKYAPAREDAKELLPPKSFQDKTSLDIWLISGHDKDDLPASEHGVFFSDHCYIVIFTVYLHGGDTRTGIYHWQGRNSSREDRGTSALLAGEIGNKMSFCSVKRMMQGKESQLFLGHFERPVVVLRGERTPLDSLSHRLLQVRGTEDTAYAIETRLDSERLNSNDTFIALEAASKPAFVWVGTGSNDNEQGNAAKVAERLGEGAPVVLKEGSESDAFWKVMGCKGQYASFEYLKQAPALNVRMFHCSNRIGIFEVHEMDAPVSQDDFQPNDAVIVDGHQNEVFVWYGSNCNEQCREMALDTAQKYVAHETDEHKKWENVPVVEVVSGEEPLALHAYFHAWDEGLQEAHRDPYAHRLRVLAKSQAKNKR